MIEIKGFYIEDKGDPSVGIFPSHFELKGPFIFEDEMDLEEFRLDLLTTFYSICENPEVIYFEDWEDQLVNELL